MPNAGYHLTDLCQFKGNIQDKLYYPVTGCILTVLIDRYGELYLHQYCCMNVGVWNVGKFLLHAVIFTPIMISGHVQSFSRYSIVKMQD